MAAHQHTLVICQVMSCQDTSACHGLQVSAERDSSNQANVALKAELERYQDVTGNTVEALEREKAVKAQLENQNKAQVTTCSLFSQYSACVS